LRAGSALQRSGSRKEELLLVTKEEGTESSPKGERTKLWTDGFASPFWVPEEQMTVHAACRRCLYSLLCLIILSWPNLPPSQLSFPCTGAWSRMVSLPLATFHWFFSSLTPNRPFFSQPQRFFNKSPYGIIELSPTPYSYA